MSNNAADPTSSQSENLALPRKRHLSQTEGSPALPLNAIKKFRPEQAPLRQSSLPPLPISMPGIRAPSDADFGSEIQQLAGEIRGHLERKEYDKIEGPLRMYARLNPRLAWETHQTRGHIAMEMGDASSAIGFYQEALLRNPNNAMLQENLSKAMAILKSIEVSKNATDQLQQVNQGSTVQSAPHPSHTGAEIEPPVRKETKTQPSSSAQLDPMLQLRGQVSAQIQRSPQPAPAPAQIQPSSQQGQGSASKTSAHIHQRPTHVTTGLAYVSTTIKTLSESVGDGSRPPPAFGATSAQNSRSSKANLASTQRASQIPQQTHSAMRLIDYPPQPGVPSSTSRRSHPVLQPASASAISASASAQINTPSQSTDVTISKLTQDGLVSSSKIAASSRRLITAPRIENSHSTSANMDIDTPSSSGTNSPDNQTPRKGPRSPSSGQSIPRVVPPASAAQPMQPSPLQGPSVMPSANIMKLMASALGRLERNMSKDLEETREELRSNTDRLEDVIRGLEGLRGSVDGNDNNPSQQFGGAGGSRHKKSKSAKIVKDPYSKETEHREFLKVINKHLAAQCLKVHSYQPQEMEKLPPPLTEDEIKAYERGDDDCITISRQNFRMDFSQSRDAPFNKEAISVAAADLIYRITEEKWYQVPTIPSKYLVQDYVEFLIRNHVKYVKSKYQLFIQQQSVHDRDKMLKAAARSSRKTRLFEARLDAVVGDIALMRHADMLSAVNTQGVSSDESEADCTSPRKSFVRVSPEWRSFELQGFMWALDKVIERDRKPRVGHRSIRGAEPRQRKFGSTTNPDAVAPPGLPRNCYDVKWVESLTQKQIRLLEVKDVVYDFSLTNPTKTLPGRPGPSNSQGAAPGTSSASATSTDSRNVPASLSSKPSSSRPSANKPPSAQISHSLSSQERALASISPQLAAGSSRKEGGVQNAGPVVFTPSKPPAQANLSPSKGTQPPIGHGLVFLASQKGKMKATTSTIPSVKSTGSTNRRDTKPIQPSPEASVEDFSVAIANVQSDED